MSDYSFFIPVVNRFDLLDKAVESSKDLWPELTIIDNSPDGLPHPYPHPIMVFRPCVPLSCPQSFNFMMRDTLSRGRKICMWMHSDAEAEEGSCMQLLHFARKCEEQERKWGVIFTNYDALSVLNATLLDTVGGYDAFFQQYYCDTDFYRRVRLAGYETLDTGIPVKHIGSQTLHSDPERQFMNGVTFPLYGQYYKSKHGGSPGEETFGTPFGR